MSGLFDYLTRTQWKRPSLGGAVHSVRWSRDVVDTDYAMATLKWRAISCATSCGVLDVVSTTSS
jgi:hypothetical protein